MTRWKFLQQVRNKIRDLFFFNRPLKTLFNFQKSLLKIKVCKVRNVASREERKTSKWHNKLPVFQHYNERLHAEDNNLSWIWKGMQDIKKKIKVELMKKGYNENIGWDAKGKWIKIKFGDRKLKTNKFYRKLIVKIYWVINPWENKFSENSKFSYIFVKKSKLKKIYF